MAKFAFPLKLRGLTRRRCLTLSGGAISIFPYINLVIALTQLTSKANSRHYFMISFLINNHLSDTVKCRQP